MFSADQDQPHASVNVDTCGGVLTDTAVRGIVALVADAVPGLTGTERRRDRPGRATRCRTRRRRSASQRPTRWRPSAPGRAAQTGDRAGHARQTGRRRRRLGDRRRPAELRRDDREDADVRRLEGRDPAARRENEKLTQDGRRERRRHRHHGQHPRRRRHERQRRARSYDHDKTTGTNAVDTTQTDTKKVGGTPTKMSVSVVVSKKALDDIVKGAARTRRTRPRPRRSSRTRSRTRSARRHQHARTRSRVGGRQAAEPVAVAEGGRRDGRRRVGAAGKSGTALGGLIPAPFGGMVQPADGRHRAARAAVPGAQVARQAARRCWARPTPRGCRRSRRRRSRSTS